MTVVGNFNFSIFLRLTWKFLDLESERGSSVCWLNNKIIDSRNHLESREHQCGVWTVGTGHWKGEGRDGNLHIQAWHPQCER